MSGVRYVVIFLGTYALTRFRPNWLTEEFSPKALWTKFAATALVVAGLALAKLG